MTDFGDFDPAAFSVANVADTCAVWNLVSSDRLCEAACGAGLAACMTSYVRYECLVKPRKVTSAEDTELQRRLRGVLERGEIRVHSLELEDLQEVELLAQRKRLGLGELSCLAFARRTGICFLTDDRKATTFARAVLGAGARAQTTPHVFGWLLFFGHLGDVDVDVVVVQHRAVRRPLEPEFRKMVTWVARCRALSRPPSEPDLGGGPS
jgi:hypothetical protein